MRHLLLLLTLRMMMRIMVMDHCGARRRVDHDWLVLAVVLAAGIATRRVLGYRVSGRGRRGERRAVRLCRLVRRGRASRESDQRIVFDLATFAGAILLLM